MFATLTFWCVMAALFVAAQLIPPANLRLRAAVLGAVSVAGVVLVLDLDYRQLALLAAAIGWVLGALWLVKPNPRAATIRTALLMIAPILLLWTVGKIAAANDQPMKWLFFIGSSFLLVKAFSLIKDRLEGKAADFEPTMGAAYFLFFPTFLSGPMHTYGEFRATMAAPEPTKGEFVDIVFRFVLGLLKVSVLAPALAPASLTVLLDAEAIPVSQAVVGAFFYSGVLYFNFSGYTDIVISVSRAMGIKVPENFDWPYLAPSIRDFWRRWHITFSRALTAHVFMPTSRALSRALPGRRFLVPAIGYLATFLFAGFWHGATPNFLLWGAWHAFGLIAQDFAQKLRPRAIGAPVKPSMPMRVLKTIATFVFVSLGWIFFVLPLEQLAKIQ